MANPQVLVEFIGKTDSLQGAMAGVAREGQGLGSNLKRIGKAAAVAGGAAGLAALFATVKTGVGELSESAKVSALTAAGIKSTGGAAKVSAKQVEDLANSLMLKTGIDDEAIQSGENMLLTFTKVHDEAGKGNDIFTQSTKVLADMSVRLGTDMPKAAIQLGKALQDPVKGITALRRVGVAFDEGQKKQIESMVKAGDVMGAQKLILAELNKEFGGSAEAVGKTLPGQVNILKQSFANLAAELLTTLVPAFTAITKFLTEHPALFKALVVGVLALAAAMVVLNVALAVTAVVSAPITGIIIGIVAAVAALAAAAYLIYKNWGAITEFFSGLWDTIKSAAQGVLDWFTSNWPLLLGILTGPIGLAVVEIVKHWDAIKQACTDAFNAIKQVVTEAWDAVKTTFTTVLEALKTAVTNAWNAIKTTVTNALDAIKTLVTNAWNAVKTTVTTAMTAIETAIETAWTAIQTAITTAVGIVKTAVAGMTAAFNLAKTAAGALATFFETAWKAATDIAGKAAGVVEGAVSGVAGAFKAAKGAAQLVVDLFNNALKKAAQVASDALDPIAGIVNGIAGAFNAAVGAVEGLISAIGRIPTHINLPSIPHLPFSAAALAVPGAAAGPAALATSRGTPTLTSSGFGSQTIEVKVFIGDTELRGLVRAEVRQADNRTAQTILAGLR